MPQADVHIIGVPLDLGGNRRGTDMGPSAFRIAGIGERLAALGLTVVDKGDILTPIPEIEGPGDPHKRYVKEIARVCQKLYQTALASLDEGALPIVLGGDHSLGAGSVAAAAAHAQRKGKPLGLIWVDAHGDMNSPATSESGNVHGMPLAALLGGEPRGAGALRWRGPGGAAGAHRAGRHPQSRRGREAAGRASGVHVFTMKDIDRLGIARGHGAGAGDRRPTAPAGFTCRSTWTSAIRRSRPASARRSRAASTTARRTW